MGHLALTNAESLQLIGSLVLLFILAQLFGTFMRRLRQPAVVGYLIAGVVLGPSGFGAAWPKLATFVLPTHGKSHLLGAVVEFSLLVVLIVLGAETDVPLVRRLGRPAGSVIAGGILLPLAAGSAVAYAFGTSLVTGDRLAGAVLVGGALGISSLPIIARLVDELGIARRDVGQLALAAATANDIYGFLLLVAVAAATAGGAGAVLRPVLGLVVLLVVFLVLGQRCVDFLFRKVRQEGPNPTGSIAVAVGVTLVAAAAMQAIGVEAALGAFFAGVAIGRSRFQHGEALVRLRSLSDAMFAPLYFASAGMLIDLKAIHSWHRLAALGALLVAAVASKAVGTAIGARFAKLRGRETAALMTLLNGRGAMQVIIATAGLRMGLLSNVAYTSVLVVSIVSSVLVTPTLRRLVGNWQGSADEERRLAYEERIEASVLVREQRLLIPELPHTDTALIASLFDRAWPETAELTLLASPNADRRADLALGRTVRYLAATEPNPLRAALDEVRLGYGVLGIGLVPGSEGLPELAAQLLNGSPVPIVLARPGNGRLKRSRGPRHIAVATTGTTAGIAAEELAASVARRHRALLHLVHISPEREDGLSASYVRTEDAELSEGILADAEGRARRAGLRPKVAPQKADSASAGLVQYAQRHHIDLLVVGTRLRQVGDAPFFGHTVEALLHATTAAALAVVAFPEAAPAELDQPYVERQAT